MNGWESTVGFRYGVLVFSDVFWFFEGGRLFFFGRRRGLGGVCVDRRGYVSEV